MKKSKFPYWFRIFKWTDAFTILITLLLLCYALIKGDAFLRNFASSFIGQITFAIYTAILTAVGFNLYSRLHKAIKNQEYMGYWTIGEFDGMEDYTLNTKYVIITEGTDSTTLHYFQEDSANLNTIKGIIYIDPENDQKAELVETIDWINQMTTTFPVHSRKIFFDSKTFLSKGNYPIVRILSHSGNEERILMKPIDQVKFKNYINGKLSDTMDQMATPLESLDKKPD